MHAEFSSNMQKSSSKDVKRQSTKLRICKYAVSMFYKNGTKNVKMDDISSKLKISKRTLYELYGDKEQLLLECMKYKAEAELEELHDFVNNKAGNVMEVLLKFYEIRMDVVKKVNPAFYSDLERYPAVLKYLKQQTSLKRARSIEFFNKGVEDGFFRKGLNYEIITRMSEAYMGYIMQNKLYDKFTMKDLFANFVSVIVRGYCTEKGLEMLEKFTAKDSKY